MQPTTHSRSDRRQSVVVVLGLDQRRAHLESARWRDQGAVVLQASDAGGCLRLATSVHPDVIVLDRNVPRRQLGLLKAHPSSARAHIEWLPTGASDLEYRAA